MPFSTLEQLRNAVDNIASLNRPWYNIEFTGGEPIIHPHIFDLISMLHERLGERLNNILLITNGSRNDVLYEKLADLAKSLSINMIISIHTDHVDMAHILKLIENLSSNVDIKFSLMFNPAKRELVHEIYNIMFEARKKHYFRMSVTTLVDGDRVDPRYTPEDLAWQKKATKQFNELEKNVIPTFQPQNRKKHGFTIIRDIEDNSVIRTEKQGNRTLKLAEGALNFKGMYCMAHTAFLRIEEDGLCRGILCGEDKFICNIYNKNSFQAVRDKLIHVVRCTKNICECSSNDRVPKFTSQEEAKKYFEFAKKRQAELFAEYDAAQQVMKNPIVEPTQNKQEDLSNEQNVAQSVNKNSNLLPWVTSNGIIGMSENSLSDYFGSADIVRKITEYEYNSGDKKSKIVYKVQDGIITDILCSLK